MLTHSQPNPILQTQYSPGPSGGPGDSESLKACQSLLDEYLPKLKALPGAKVTRQVCGGCLDFKVSIAQPPEEHGAWADADYNPVSLIEVDRVHSFSWTSAGTHCLQLQLLSSG